MSKVSSTGEELKVGDIVLIGSDSHQQFGIIYGFTPTGLIQIAEAGFRKEYIPWPNGAWYNNELDETGKVRGYQYTEPRYYESKANHHYASKMYIFNDQMLMGIPNQELAAKIKGLQTEILCGDFHKRKKKK